MKVEELIASPETAAQAVLRVVQETESHLRAGMDTLVMTSRALVTGGDELSSLKIGSVVAEALVGVLQRIEVQPRFIIAKVLYTGILFSHGFIGAKLLLRGGSHLRMLRLRA